MNKKMLAQEIYTNNGVCLNVKFKNIKDILHIGCGHNKLEGSIGMDVLDLKEVDVVHNLDFVPWPIENSSLDFIFAHNVLEHLLDIPSVMKEIARVLRPGGRAVITVPYFRHVDAVTDPTHKHLFTSRSMEYFIETGKGLAGYDYTNKLFKKNGFWYGWPHEPKNPIKRIAKRILQHSHYLYDQYISYFFPAKILIWELEKK